MRKFNERISEVEFGTFSPLVFSNTGSYGAILKSVYKKLATLMSSKYQKHTAALSVIFDVDSPL